MIYYTFHCLIGQAFHLFSQNTIYSIRCFSKESSNISPYTVDLSGTGFFYS